MGKQHNPILVPVALITLDRAAASDFDRFCPLPEGFRLLCRSAEIRYPVSLLRDQNGIALICFNQLDSFAIKNLFAAKAALSKKTKIIAWARTGEKPFVHEVLDGGILGILLEPVTRKNLNQALRIVNQGGIFLNQTVNELLSLHQVDLEIQSRWKLTYREYQILRLQKEGMPYKQIADHLRISLNTVNNHLASVRTKLGVHSAIEAINKVFPS